MDKTPLDELDKRMRAAWFKPDRRQSRFQRRRSAAAPEPRSRRSPEDKLRIREMQIGKHYRCLLARRGVEAAAAYSEQVGPLLNGQGDVEAAKALFEQVDRWMRLYCRDDMAGWKRAHPELLGTVHRPMRRIDRPIRTAAEDAAWNRRLTTPPASDGQRRAA